MRWNSSKFVSPYDRWRRWWAWYPVRVPNDDYSVNGVWVWLEYVERYSVYHDGYVDCEITHTYRLID